MDNPIMEPSEVFYGKPDSDASDSTTDEVITETEAGEELANQADEELDNSESELEESELEEGDQDESEQLYVELDGEEVSLDDIKSWKDGHLMQADYTRKTQELADGRAALDTEKSELANKSESIANLIAELEASIDVEDEVDMDELREYDPSEYLKLKEKGDKRKELLSKAKESLNTTKPVSDADVAQERKLLISDNPSWIDDKGNATADYKQDMKSLDAYLASNGWTQEEFSTVYQAKHIQALIKAAKFDALQGKSKAAVKKLKKAPVVKRGKQKQKTDATIGTKSMKDIFYSK